MIKCNRCGVEICRHSYPRITMAELEGLLTDPSLPIRVKVRLGKRLRSSRRAGRMFL